MNAEDGTRSNAELRRELLELQVEFARKRAETEKWRSLAWKEKALREQAEAERPDPYQLPHRRQYTNVWQEKDRWVCSTGEKGDSLWDIPTGWGDTPQQACDDFDRNWIGE